MSDLISRKALCEFCLNTKDRTVDANDIMRFPSAEPERKKGEWIYDTERVADSGWTLNQYHCSECGEQEIGAKRNFCPNCGADMRGE